MFNLPKNTEINFDLNIDSILNYSEMKKIMGSIFLNSVSRITITNQIDGIVKEVDENKKIVNRKSMIFFIRVVIPELNGVDSDETINEHKEKIQDSLYNLYIQFNKRMFFVITDEEYNPKFIMYRNKNFCFSFVDEDFNFEYDENEKNIDVIYNDFIEQIEIFEEYSDHRIQKLIDIEADNIKNNIDYSLFDYLLINGVYPDNV